MKSTRICPGCKWEYPWTFQGTLCSFCKTTFAEQICNTCKVWQPTENYYKRTYPDGKTYSRKECKTCMRERKKAFDKKNRQQRYDRDRRFWDTRKEELETRYNTWKEAIAKLPFKPISEQEWLAACSHFGGCAICGDDHIETRQYFIPFKDGGKYTAYNVFPMCGKCSTHAKRLLNPFTWFDRYYGKGGLNVTKEAGEKLVAYLELQITKVVKENESQTGGI